MRTSKAGRRRRPLIARGGSAPTGWYRVWITRIGLRMPQDCADVPPDAVAREPAEPEAMSAAQAARYVEAFNRTAQARRRKLRAVALPVTVTYEGEPVPGERLGGRG
jgi:hypothetical protein